MVMLGIVRASSFYLWGTREIGFGSFGSIVEFDCVLLENSKTKSERIRKGTENNRLTRKAHTLDFIQNREGYLVPICSLLLLKLKGVKLEPNTVLWSPGGIQVVRCISARSNCVSWNFCQLPSTTLAPLGGYF